MRRAWVFLFLLHSSFLFSRETNPDVRAELMLNLKYATKDRHMEQLIPLLKQLDEIPANYWTNILSAVHETRFREVRLYIMRRFLNIYPFEKTDTVGRKFFVQIVQDEFEYLLDREHHNEEEIEAIRLSLSCVEEFELYELFYPTAAFIAYPLVEIRKLSYKALAVLEDDRMFPLLLQLADSPNPVERTYAVDAFYYIRDDRIMPILLDLINDHNKTVRYYVIRTLENMNATEAVPYIIRIVRSDSNSEVRVRAIQMLEKLKPRSAIGVLNTSVSDENAEVRQAAVKALIAYDYKNSSYVISRQLEKEEVNALKLLEIQALLSLSNAGGMDGLNKIMKEDKNVEILLWAIYTTGKLEENRGVDVLIQNLSHKNTSVRMEAAFALAAIKNRAAIAPLMERLSDEKEDYKVQAAALYALYTINDSSTIPELFDLSEEHPDPYIRGQIKIRLREMLARRFEK